MSKSKSRMDKELLEMAGAQHRFGLMDDATYRKITLRHLGTKSLGVADPISGAEIRNIRESAHLSQAAFARFLNLTVGYVSQLERGTKQPKGPALTLLNVMRRKGFDAIL